MKRILCSVLAAVLLFSMPLPALASGEGGGGASGGGGAGRLNEYINEDEGLVWDSVLDAWIYYTGIVYDYASRNYTVTVDGGTIGVCYSDENISYSYGVNGVNVDYTYSYGTENQTFFDWLLYWGSGAGAIGVIADFWRSITSPAEYEAYVEEITGVIGSSTLRDGGIRYYFYCDRFDYNDSYFEKTGESLGKNFSIAGVPKGNRSITVRFRSDNLSFPFRCYYEYGSAYSGTGFTNFVYTSSTGTKNANNIFYPDSATIFTNHEISAYISITGTCYVDIYPVEEKLDSYYPSLNITVNSRPGVVSGYIPSSGQPAPTPTPNPGQPLPTYNPDPNPTPEPGEEDSSPSNWFWKLLDWLGDRIDSVVEFFGGILGRVVDALASLIDLILDGLFGLVRDILNKLDEILDFLYGLFSRITGFLLDLITDLFEIIFSFLRGLWEFLSGVFDGFADSVTSFFEFFNSDVFDVFGADVGPNGIGTGGGGGTDGGGGGRP